jgi:hypothetical protein
LEAHQQALSLKLRFRKNNNDRISLLETILASSLVSARPDEGGPLHEVPV